VSQGLHIFGQFERRLIGQRTKEALAAKKASGVRPGRSIARSMIARWTTQEEIPGQGE